MEIIDKYTIGIGKNLNITEEIDFLINHGVGIISNISIEMINNMECIIDKYPDKNWDWGYHYGLGKDNPNM